MYIKHWGAIALCFALASSLMYCELPDQFRLPPIFNDRDRAADRQEDSDPPTGTFADLEQSI
ncbi:hypothetical protein C7B61_19575, partial [filamentous cyanobacterium CCP1]